MGPQGGNQELVQIDKLTTGEVTKTRLMGVIYVPLTDKKKQWNEGTLFFIRTTLIRTASLRLDILKLVF